MTEATKNKPLETPKEKMLQYIEKMDDYQARLVLSFIKNLFNLSD